MQTVFRDPVITKISPIVLPNQQYMCYFNVVMQTMRCLELLAYEPERGSDVLNAFHFFMNTKLSISN
jgi:hypothetical protein